MKVLESLLGLIQNTPRDDPKSQKLHDDMEKIRAKFRQVLHLLCERQLRISCNRFVFMTFQRTVKSGSKSTFEH